MVFVVGDILRLIFRFLFSKIRDKGVENFKYGDVSDEWFREFIVCEFMDICEKFEGLCKVDLIIFVNFFKDGVSLMY